MARGAPVGMWLLLAMAGTGCPKPRPRYAGLEEAGAAVRAGREAAFAAREARDGSAALLAAELAADALAQAEALEGTAPVGSQTSPLGELRRVAREAREAAQETDERVRLEAALGGLKARTYRGVRAAAVQGGFLALAQAARQADQRGLEQLPPQVRDAALDAAAWAESATGRARRPDGTPDWAGVAADMEGFAAAPPSELGLTLALGFLVLGKSGLALFETEALDPASARDPGERLALCVLRGYARDANGYRRLAVLEVEAGLDALGAGPGVAALDAGAVTLSGAQVVGGAHLVLAVVYLHEEDYGAADRELAQALAAWPDCPIASALTGETLLASGERERGLSSLEAAAQGQGEEAEWLAGRIAARARAIRDGEEDPDGGLVGDPEFLARLALRALWQAARTSPEAARARDQVARARAFCGDLLERLPGVGGEVAPVESGAPGR